MDLVPVEPMSYPPIMVFEHRFVIKLKGVGSNIIIGNKLLVLRLPNKRISRIGTRSVMSSLRLGKRSGMTTATLGINRPNPVNMRIERLLSDKNFTKQLQRFLTKSRSKKMIENIFDWHYAPIPVEEMKRSSMPNLRLGKKSRMPNLRLGIRKVPNLRLGRRSALPSLRLGKRAEMDVTF